MQYALFPLTAGAVEIAVLKKDGYKIILLSF